MKILKFGGTSVGTPERIKQVIAIVKDAYQTSNQVCVVVSAFGGVTDDLIKVSQLAATGNPHYKEQFEKIKKRHFDACEALAISHPSLEAIFNELFDALHGVQLIKEISKKSLDFIMSFGERLSALIIATATKVEIPFAQFLDARELILTDNNFGNARLLEKESYQQIRNAFSNSSILSIVTGFIGSTSKQETTTLGRGGSDFTAAIFGAALNAEIIEIWTDVDGVMTADPRKVKQAFPIDRMSYKEALEMCYFGAKVIHPPTITPALRQNIPLLIKNTFNPTAKGTFISHESSGNDKTIRGISSIDRVALLRLEGSGMVGMWGVASRLFGSLAKKEISVILISQASSEHSICFAIPPHSAVQAKESIEAEFALEIKAGYIDPVIIEEEMSIVAAVGEAMQNTPGIAGRLFESLGKNGINIVAIAQGSSEYNISVVVRKEDEVKALNVIHEEFFLSHTVTLNLFIVGIGLIGKTLLEQMEKQISSILKEHAIDIKVIALANSKTMLFSSEGIDLSHWHEALDIAEDKMQLPHFIEKMKQLNLMNSVFVDCTSSQQVADAYSEIANANISIVTPNKKANSGPYTIFKKLKETAVQRGIKFLYETNVGAGLPIIGTIHDMLVSGDKIIKIEAILSGTLSFIFNELSKGKKFSEALKEAEKRGFTEPDPRDDLNGLDVMRKLLILVRESGYPLELDQITMQPLLPENCFKAKTLQQFYQEIEKCDSHFEGHKVLRHIAKFENGKATISVETIDQRHPFYHLSGNDNVVALTTERYKENPLVIKGPGAGAQVTAGGVFADIIRCASR